MALKVRSKEELREDARERQRNIENQNLGLEYMNDFNLSITKEDLEKKEVKYIPISSLSESPKNFFSKVSGDKREEMIASLKSYGQINPIIIRPRRCVEEYKDEIEGDYEILVGHTRVELLKEIGKEKVKAIIIECSDVDATLIINQSNIQRENVSDIEIARGYKATYEAVKKDKDSNLMVGDAKNENVEISTISPTPQIGTSGEVKDRTDEIVAEKYGISKNTLRRKMALADCIDEVVSLYEKKKLTQEDIGYISRLDEYTQKYIVDSMSEIKDEQKVKGKIISKAALKEVYEESRNYDLNKDNVKEIIEAHIENIEPKKIEGSKYIIPDKLFPDYVSKKERIEYLQKLLSYALDEGLEIRMNKDN